VTDRTFDPGAQNERTSLAWTRTGLAVLVAAVLATRLTVGHLGGLALVAGALAVPAGLAVLVLAVRRYQAAHRALHDGSPLPDGRLPALVSAAVLLVGALEVAYALTS
jgi:putative membrane protein